MMTPFVDVIVMLRARAGCAGDLCEILRTLQKSSLQESGCLGYRIARGEVMPDTFYLLERWVNAEALEYHEQTAHYRDGVARVGACCEFVNVQKVEWICD